MLSDLLRSKSLRFFQERISQNDSFVLENLWSSAKAAMIAIAQKAKGKNVVVITGGTREDRLFENFVQFHIESILEFPSWETLPGEEISPSPDILGKRFEALASLNKNSSSIILCSLQAILQKLIPKQKLDTLFHTLSLKQKISFGSLPELLASLGYRRSSVVSDKGEFAVRGGIIDLFPVASSDPFRVEFFGDEIESIRTFDPIGQKSTGKQSSIFLSPADEWQLLRNQETTHTLIDYLGEDPLIIFDDLLAIEDNYISLKEMPGFKSPFILSFFDFLNQIEPLQKLYFTPQSIEELSHVKKGEIQERSTQHITFEIFEREISATRYFHPFMKVIDFLYTEPPEDESSFALLDHLPPHLEVSFLNRTEAEEKDLKNAIENREATLPEKTHFNRGYLSKGFVVTDIPFAVIPRSEFITQPRVRRQKWRSTYHTPAAEFHELTPGDLVVHFHGGIGKYLGIEKQTNHLGVETEFMTIAYAESGKLFVPLSQAHLVSRYIGAREEVPVLSTLGSKRWQKTKMQAQKQIIGYASELLELYAERELESGYIYPEDSDDMIQFEIDFPYVETPDQMLAIESIKKDMTQPKPMDRLICGDVGYGKTEVAMRAAFKAVCDGKKQVAVLVPTTVLAMQHYETFSERMQPFPMMIEPLSRVKKPKEIRETLHKVKEGSVDIVIGTHRILSKDVQFKNLGLIIIDEEQRFGVKAKEHLKRIKKGIDCITLSATPIPRTLYMSMIQARDMSVINTPPQDRLPIKTIIAEAEDTLIQNALLREFSRGGQAFFIHNRVETIAKRAEYIRKLVPNARIAIVHGQMDPEAADNIFHKFKMGEADLLFATTIVENGVDIPNANTILIDRADHYGLADLYQLRGRVGRWNRAAYAYFLTPKNFKLSDISRKRLTALIESGSHGGGMKIAMRDLEIRGAGDILGTQQSGQISAIGFHLYCKLLKRTIQSLKNKGSPSIYETKMEFTYDAGLPHQYISETSLRMEVYYRLGEAGSFEDVDEIFNELRDRFGEPPFQVLWLYHLTRIRVFASMNQFTLIKFGTLSLIAEQVRGKNEYKKNIVFSKEFTSPKELEEFTILMLRHHFKIQKFLK